MKITETAIPGVLIFTPKIYSDARGAFQETYNERVMREAGLPTEWRQDNTSVSKKNVIRGIHYQVIQPQGKLVRAVEGEILDVAVDLRRSSANFGKWEAVRLSGENKRMLWIPVGFAHGFCVISKTAQVLYKATDYYAPEHERTISWNDADLKINWQLDGEPIVSAKDQRGVALRDAQCFE